MRRFMTAALATAALALPAPDTASAQGAGDTTAAPVAGLVEQFDDWQVSCTSGPQVICTMAQDVRARGSDDRLISARVDLESAQGLRLTLITPLGIDLEAPLALYPGLTDDLFATASLRVCQPVGCYGFVFPDDAALEQLSEFVALRVIMTPFNGAPAEVPLSLRGFDAALERLRALQG